jgi:3,5-epimerase/4-reductase
MKFLIFGQHGWIGSIISSLLLSSNHSIIPHSLRADDYFNIKQLILSQLPDRILCFIGRTSGFHNNSFFPSIDFLELPNKLPSNINDNLYSPLILALLASHFNIHLTYIGTGCIFNYDASHNLSNMNGFTEEDEPNFYGSSYSIVKGFTDKIMHLDCFNKNVLNLRIRMPIVSYTHPKNFITKITNYKKICSIPNSMTFIDEFKHIIIDMSINKHVGTFNLTNPGLISHNEILELYKKYVDHSFTWENFDIIEQDKILLSKRSNNLLNTSKIQQLYHVNDIKTAIELCLKNYKL